MNLPGEIHRAKPGKDIKMILADKIINERKKNGWSQEELAEMLSVSRQSVSKWESAQAVPDLAKIIKLAEIFGVSTDYLLKDEIEAEPGNVATDVSEIVNVRKVSLEDASSYIEIVKRNTPAAVIATMLFVLCPVILIELAGVSSVMPNVISEVAAAALGLICLFICIVVGVIMWITIEAKEKDMAFMEKEEYDTLYGVDGMVKEKKNAFEKKRLLLTTLAVALFILSPIGVVTSGILSAPALVIVSMVSLLLVMVACGVGILIYTGRTEGIYKKLLKEDMPTPEQKRADRISSKLSGAYWCLVVAVFMVFGLGYNKWQLAGIIFPVAGIIYAAFIGICKIFIEKE